jgi:ferredoxin-like protein FixX
MIVAMTVTVVAMPTMMVAIPSTVWNPDAAAVAMTAMPVAAACPASLLDRAPGSSISLDVAECATCRCGLSRACKQSDRQSHGGSG